MTILFSLIVSSLFMQRRSLNLYAMVNSNEDHYYLPPSSWLKVFSLGYNEAAADIIWTKFVIYFSSTSKKAVKTGDYSHYQNTPPLELTNQSEENHSLKYVLAVTELNPQFRDAFSHGARLTMYQNGVITRHSLELAIGVLKAGIKQFPNDGDLYFNLGFLDYYEMMPFTKSDEEKADFQDLGTKLIHKAANMPGAPPHATALASTLLLRHGMDDLVINHLVHMLASETDSAIRAHIETELKRLLGKRVESDIKALDALHRIWQRQFGFLPFDLFTVLYSPPYDLTDVF